jgi:hypothetical protein
MTAREWAALGTRLAMLVLLFQGVIFGAAGVLVGGYLAWHTFFGDGERQTYWVMMFLSVVVPAAVVPLIFISIWRRAGSLAAREAESVVSVADQALLEPLVAAITVFGAFAVVMSIRSLIAEWFYFDLMDVSASEWFEYPEARSRLVDVCANLAGALFLLLAASFIVRVVLWAKTPKRESNRESS